MKKPFSRKCYNFAREIVSLVLWLCITVKVVVWEIDVAVLTKYCPELLWILNYKLVITTFVLAVVMIFWKVDFIRNFVTYIAFYPLVLLFLRLPMLMFKNWPLAIVFSPVIHEFFGSFRMVFTSYALALMSSIVIVKADNKWALIGAVSGMLVFLAVYLFRSSKKAYRATVFSGVAGLVKRFRGNIESKTKGFDFWAKKEEGNDSGEDKEYEQQLTGFYLFHWGIEIAADKVNEVAQSRRMDLYLFLSWLWTALVVVVVFAFEYYAIHKLVPNAFNENNASFWAYLGFSFGKIAPASVSALRPVHLSAILFSYLELFCSLVILFMFFFTFTTVARQRYQEDLNIFIQELRDTTVAVEKQFYSVYSMALVDVERALATRKGEFVNQLRKMRGLSEIEINKDQTTAEDKR